MNNNTEPDDSFSLLNIGALINIHQQTEQVPQLQLWHPDIIAINQCQVAKNPGNPPPLVSPGLYDHIDYLAKDLDEEDENNDVAGTFPQWGQSCITMYLAYIKQMSENDLVSPTLEKAVNHMTQYLNWYNSQ